MARIDQPVLHLLAALVLGHLRQPQRSADRLLDAAIRQERPALGCGLDGLHQLLRVSDADRAGHQLGEALGAVVVPPAQPLD